MPIVLEPIDGSPKCGCRQPHIQYGESGSIVPISFSNWPVSAYFTRYVQIPKQITSDDERCVGELLELRDVGRDV